MREILFRGKRFDNGEWVYGYVWKNPREQYFITEYNTLTMYAVIPESVGQYTGIKDENGKGIYEGDIIRFIKENCLVNFVENDCAFRVEVDSRISTALRKAHSKDYEVIGNIHDEEEPNEATH